MLMDFATVQGKYSNLIFFVTWTLDSEGRGGMANDDESLLMGLNIMNKEYLTRHQNQA